MLTFSLPKHKGRVEWCRYADMPHYCYPLTLSCLRGIQPVKIEEFSLPEFRGHLPLPPWTSWVEGIRILMHDQSGCSMTFYE